MLKDQRERERVVAGFWRALHLNASTSMLLLLSFCKEKKREVGVPTPAEKSILCNFVFTQMESTV